MPLLWNHRFNRARARRTGEEGVKMCDGHWSTRRRLIATWSCTLLTLDDSRRGRSLKKSRSSPDVLGAEFEEKMRATPSVTIDGSRGRV
ncbi:uncharacterized protein PHACADRAFT_264841 [Phanerochaete carnosa HHB-10118-sp]|uniref:Uncharacterized protein n=1 Tax=Phanerochaete carnosa (strain HHB-10118-sp) TaxID=650164 RepID=K5VG85_PHACS|nr:uncharacterized protein PHACADRAFT_264841 [Phanerochaete carnosa HHB-10118-sp]EKM50228.1 hypothetical protein PHACADRAFT_264841 [Phanerochaete carnosa HHB-10118-sp]